MGVNLLWYKARTTLVQMGVVRYYGSILTGEESRLVSGERGWRVLLRRIREKPVFCSLLETWRQVLQLGGTVWVGRVELSLGLLCDGLIFDYHQYW